VAKLYSSSIGTSNYSSYDETVDIGVAPQTALPIETTVTLPIWSHLILNILHAFPLKQTVSF
jgi:hypothetical protein